MIPVEWLLAVAFLFGGLLYLVLALLLRENRALTRALIAKTPQELHMLEKSPGSQTLRDKIRRRVPETEGEFNDSRPRTLGL